MGGNGGNSGTSSANMASRGGGFNARGRVRGGARGCVSFGGRQGGQFNGNRPMCQLCGREGHTVVKCYKRFDATFTGAQENKSAAAVTKSYGIDTDWLMDSSATDHITGELDKLTVKDKYHDNDQVRTANGSGMMINQIGHSTLHTPSRNLSLKNILYVPESLKV